MEGEGEPEIWGGKFDDTLNLDFLKVSLFSKKLGEESDVRLFKSIVISEKNGEELGVRLFKNIVIPGKWKGYNDALKYHQNF